MLVVIESLTILHFGGAKKEDVSRSGRECKSPASFNPLIVSLNGIVLMRSYVWLTRLLHNALQVPVLVFQALLFALDRQLVQQSLIFRFHFKHFVRFGD